MFRFTGFTLGALSSPAISAALLDLPGWARGEKEINTLTKTYTFACEVQETAFINGYIQASNAINHQPEIEVVYNELLRRPQVLATLTTHDAGSVITDKDIRLAKAMEKSYLVHQPSKFVNSMLLPKP